MNSSEKVKSIIDKIKSNKKIQIVLVVILSIFIVIFLLSNFSSEETNTVTENSINEYVLSLENRLEETLSKVEGAGKVSVVITVESGMETVIATETTIKETSSGTEKKEAPVIVNGKPIVLMEMYPKITGVVIVTEGANSISVLSKIQQATISLLGINLDQIEILKMK